MITAASSENRPECPPPCVQRNEPGPDDEWRNGALNIQAVELYEEDAEDAFTTDLTMSAGGVHGVATDGLIWEGNIFWHRDGPCYHEDGWSSYVP